MKNKNSAVSVLRQSYRSNPLLCCGMAAAILGAVLTALLPPLVLERIIDLLTQGGEISTALIAFYLVLLAVSGIFDAAKEGLITIFGQKVTHSIRSEMCCKLSRLPAAYYTQNETGIITSRFVNDVDTVENLFDSGIISMAADVCKFIGILAIIFVKSKGLGVLMLLVTPLFMLFTLAVQRRMLQAQLQNRVAVGRANNHIPETIRDIRMLHTTDAEPYMEKKYSCYIRDGYAAVEKSNFYDAVYSPVILFTSSVIIGAMMVLSAMGGGMQSFFGMSVGTAVAVISYVGKIFDPLESIGMEIQNIQSAVAGLHRISDFLKAPERAPAPYTAEMDKCADAISFDNVAFGYEPGQEILHHASFSVKSKENVTLTGRTGAGKSTAFKLILGMYAPWQGAVKIYGVPADALTDAVRAQTIGYVEQSFHRVAGTVREQITLHDPQISDAQVLDALALVGLEGRIAELSEGLSTPCTDALFSQGQLQLLSIARAVVRNPPILLLDEITANLDTLTERAVLRALEKASANRTVLSISHRVFEQLTQQNSCCIALATATQTAATV